MPNRKLDCLLMLLVLLGCWNRSETVFGQESETKADETAEQSLDKTQQRYQEFEKLMSGCKMIGRFSIDGRDGELKEETYEIKSVKKLADGDLWLFNVRIRYGDHDVTVPLPLPVLWAGDAPVITVDNVAIPGLGTFDSRVVISDGKYAGTWQHGKVGGHLFGKVIQAEEEKAEQPNE